MQNGLHLAIINKDLKTVCKLLCLDSEKCNLVNTKDVNGNTPMDLARGLI